MAVSASCLTFVVEQLDGQMLPEVLENAGGLAAWAGDSLRVARAAGGGRGRVALEARRRAGKKPR